MLGRERGRERVEGKRENGGETGERRESGRRRGEENLKSEGQEGEV